MDLEDKIRSTLSLTTMIMNEEQIQRFQELNLKTFGVELTKEEALAQGIMLVTLIKTILENMDQNPTYEKS